MSRTNLRLYRSFLRFCRLTEPAAPFSLTRREALRALGEGQASAVLPFLPETGLQSRADVEQAVKAAWRAASASTVDVRQDLAFTALRALQTHVHMQSLMAAKQASSTASSSSTKWEPGLKTASTAVTQGLRVSVASAYLPERSATGDFHFTYTVTFVNEGSQPVQLANRVWRIETVQDDGRVTVERVRGPGVVGQHPKLLTGERFSYVSFCVLTKPQGCMSGEFTFIPLTGDPPGAVTAVCAPFALDAGPQHPTIVEDTS